MRSYTAETLFSSDRRHIAKSAGTSLHARVKITSDLIRWSDIIFPMEKKHEDFLRETFPGETAMKQIINLDIPDNYYYMEPALVELIKARTAPYLKEDQP